jgi:hypothetical protein
MEKNMRLLQLALIVILSGGFSIGCASSGSSEGVRNSAKDISSDKMEGVKDKTEDEAAIQEALKSMRKAGKAMDKAKGVY